MEYRYWKRISNFFTLPTDAIRAEDYRSFVVFNVGMVVAFLIHLSVVPLFAVFGVTPMVWLNIPSLSAYFVGLQCARRGWFFGTMVIATIELIVHQALVVHFIGWEAGFQYYILSVTGMIFFLPSGRPLIKVTLLSAAAFGFVLIQLFFASSPPVYAIDMTILKIMHNVNIVVVFFLLGIFANVYGKAAVWAETRLLTRLNIALNSANVGLWEWDVEEDKMFFSREWKRQIGYQPSELPDQFEEFDVRLHPEDRDRTVKNLNDYIARPTSDYSDEFRLRHKDGSYRWIHSQGKGLVGRNNRIVKLHGCHLDITGRKRAEEERLESDTKYRSMMESITDPLYICSPKLTVEYMNPAMIKRIGRNAIGDTCYTVLHSLDHKCDGCVFDEVTNGISIETVITSSLDGRNYRVTNMPIQNQNGTISKMSIFRDITAFLTAVAEKDKAQDQLLQSQKMESIGALAGGIAHDFNNILYPIIGHTEMLMDDLSEERSSIRDSLNAVYSSSLRARDLVQQILAFARQEKNELKLMKMQPIIKEAMKLIRSTIPTTISITQNLQPGCGPVMADPTQIHQIVMNLATNAYHAMEETGGELKVALKEIELGRDDLINPDMSPGLYACLTIADTGVGINKEIMDRIFDPFFTTKEKGKGTGMGLSVVHGIVKHMNGDIQVCSEPGKGTEFHIFLPIVKSADEKHKNSTNLPIIGGTESILLVDDEDPILKMERQVLERLGYQVTSRTSSIEALEAFRANPDKFDLVITDMAMPKMPGDKLAVELIKIRPGIPILLCTGYSESMTTEKIKFLGIKGFLKKPIVIMDLAPKIREILDNALVKTQQ